MFDYSEPPPLSRIYHEEYSSSASRKLPVPVFQDKETDKDKTPADPKAVPGPRRPKRTPSRLYNPDPVLPGLQIMITEDLQAKVIVYKS